MGNTNWNAPEQSEFLLHHCSVSQLDAMPKRSTKCLLEFLATLILQNTRVRHLSYYEVYMTYVGGQWKMACLKSNTRHLSEELTLVACSRFPAQAEGSQTKLPGFSGQNEQQTRTFSIFCLLAARTNQTWCKDDHNYNLYDFLPISNKIRSSHIQAATQY